MKASHLMGQAMSRRCAVAAVRRPLRHLHAPARPSSSLAALAADAMAATTKDRQPQPGAMELKAAQNKKGRLRHKVLLVKQPHESEAAATGNAPDAPAAPGVHAASPFAATRGSPSPDADAAARKKNNQSNSRNSTRASGAYKGSLAARRALAAISANNPNAAATNTADASTSSTSNTARRPRDVNHHVENKDSSDRGRRRSHTLEVREADFDAFEAALQAQDRASAWLKFRDVCFDPSTRRRLDKSHFVDLLRIFASRIPPKLDAMREIIAIARNANVEDPADLYSPLIEAYGRLRDIVGARGVLAEMASAGIKPTVATYNQFLRISAKSVNLATAEAMFAQMRKEPIQPDHETFEILISAAVAESNFDAARAHHASMLAEGVEPQLSTQNALLNMHFKEGKLEPAIAFFRSMTDGTVSANASICTTLIRGFSASANMGLAQEVIDWMVKSNIYPEPGSFSPLVEARIYSDNIMDAFCILKTMEDLSPYPDMSLYYSFISAACKLRHVDSILRVCDNIRARGFRPTVAIYRVVLSALVDAGRINDACVLFEQIQTEGYNLTIPIYNTMLRAASVTLDVDLARKLWAIMTINDSKLEPNGESYAALLDVYIAAHIIPDALRLCDEMHQRGFMPGPHALFKLVNVAVRARRYTAAAHAVMLLRRSCAASSNTTDASTSSFPTASQSAKPAAHLATHSTDTRAEVVSTEPNLAEIMKQYQKEFDALILDIASDAVHEVDKRNGKTADRHKAKDTGGITDAETADHVLHASETKRHHTLALEIYRELISAGVVPTEVAMRAIMNVHHRQRDLIGVVKIWTTLQKAYRTPSPESVSVLLAAASDLGQQRTAQALRTMIDSERLPLNRAGFESLITLSARCGLSDAVVHSMLDMVNAGISPTPELYRAICRALDRSKSRFPASRKAILGFIEEQFPEIIVNDEDGDASDHLPQKRVSSIS